MHRLQLNSFMVFNICPALLSILLLSSVCCFGPATCAVLHRDDSMALQKIVERMGTKLLNSSHNPCDPKMLMIPPYPPDSTLLNNTIKCNCQFDNNSICRITRIILKSYSLPGVLPPELVNLTYLDLFDVTRNYLHGGLPKEWANMKYLTYISLTANRLSGVIPQEWGSFPGLNYLSVEANRLTGNIPEELGNLVHLTSLIFASNQFVGNLPAKLAGLKNLTDLRLSDNNFSGRIPDFIGNWTQLKRLQIEASGLEGPIPPSILRLEQLAKLRISDMSGASFSFPDLPNKDQLDILVLRNLNMSGRVPPFVWEMDSLKMLDISFNKLEGEIPSSANIPKFTFLSGNMLSGTPPSTILGTDYDLDLSYNNFTWSSCPDESKNVNLYRSSSANNNSNGLLLCSSGCPKNYSSFHINCGGETVIIENEYGKISYEGDKDSEAGASRNYFTTNWGLSSTGDFMDDDSKDDPSRYIESNSLELSTNPSESYMTKLYMTGRNSPLSLTYYGFCLKNINYTVSLHFAEIKFRDKELYNRLGRRIFDIYIQGKLEWKDFNIMEEANGIGKSITKQINVTVTDHTLEIRLYWAGKGTTCIPKRGVYGVLISAISVCPSSKPHCAEPEKTSKIPIIVGVVILGLCIVFFILCVLYWRLYLRDKSTREKELRGIDLQTGSFSMRQIKAATNNFDPANKIGEGGFGPVYKGQLSDGSIIAVKQLSSKSSQGNREFVTEIGMISGLQHPNLVKLYGCCIEGNQLLLVYEYMENNSLASLLFGVETSGLKLDWVTRYKICIGMARGLRFLHEESPLKIVHRDIKATNVLLDGDLNAKISDFGLAKLNEDENTHISTRIAGTIGYMAPEYALWGYLTDKADIYSFGVVALEIVSGKSNSSYKPENECLCLLDWAFVLQQKGSLMEIMDPKLGSEFNKEEAERMIKVALLCINASSALRPTMSTVVSMLEGRTIIQDVISDPSIYAGDMKFQPSLRDSYQQMHAQSSSGSQSAMFSSDGEVISSTSEQDLYKINPDSISCSEGYSLLSYRS